MNKPLSKKSISQVTAAKVLAVQLPQLETAFAKIASDWKRFLQNSGITLPKHHSSQWFQLAILKHFQKKAVHKNDAAQLIAKITNKPPVDQQIRHLKTQSGWYVLNRGDILTIAGEVIHNPDGCHVMVSSRKVMEGTTFSRRSVVEKGDWETLLAEYKHTCASCGTKIGEQHRFDPSFFVETLERGHMNPSQPLAPGNIIPQCRWCNRTARSDFTFDEQGRPRAVASIRPVRRADAAVKKVIRKYFLKKTDDA